MNKNPPTLGRMVVIVGFALSCFGLLMFLWLAFGGPVPLQPQGYRFKASFTDATTLAAQGDVRAAGVSIGKVTKTELDPRGNATLATIELDEKYAPIHDDARAILRQKTLLGETYVEMTLGSKGAPILPEDARLNDTQVAEAVEFDELLRIFDPATRKTFQRWQATLAQATEGRAQDVNDSLGNLPEFTASAQSVVDVLHDRRESLRSLVRETGTTFEAITRNEEALQRFIVDSSRVFEVLGARRDSLAESFQILPTFERESRALLRRTRDFAVDTEPLIEDLRPVLADARPTLDSLRRLSPDLERLFGDLDPLIAAGDVGFPPLAEVLRELDPTLRATGPFLQQLNPLLEYLEVQQPTVSDFVTNGGVSISPTVPEGSDAPGGTGQFANGHALPQLVMLGNQSLPTLQRSENNRGNAYHPPGWLRYDDYINEHPFILPSFDCAHLGGPRPRTDREPACGVMDPYAFQGEQAKFPAIQANPPGGRSLQRRPGQVRDDDESDGR
ncbi:MAG TPA: MlaD family protein [Solirubrobacteraceae bacterium]|nr:MlaD family protein [Solirubrobacteraceae bacterium]